MSNGFKSAQAAEKPKLACVGRLSGLGDTGFTDSGDYIKLQILIDGYGASQNARLTFLYRPEWFVPGFDPSSYEGVEGVSEAEAKRLKSYLGVYRRNIAEQDATSTLLGLCGGDEEAYNELATKLFSLDLQSLIDQGVEGVKQIPEVVKTAIAEFFDNQDAAGKRIGYILQQQSRKTDEVDENGKNIYVRGQYYEIGDGFGNSGFYVPDEKGRKRMASRAAKAQGKFRVCFTDEDIPY